VIIKTINVDDPQQCEQIRKTVRDVLENTLGRLNLPERIVFEVKRHPDHLAVEWDGKVEAAIRGLPDPDLLRAKLYKTHAIVDLRISGVRINY
jgi:hypothetical protein